MRLKDIDPLSPIGMALQFQVSQLRKRRRQKRIRPQKQPLTIERRYEAATRDLVGESEGIIRAGVFPELSDLERRAADGDSSWPAAVAAMFAAAGLLWSERAEAAGVISEVAASEVSAFNRVEIGRQMRAITGLDLTTGGQKTPSLIAAFVEEANPRIKGLGDQQISEIRGIVTRGMQSGRRAASIEGEIRERFAINKQRATFIARNELGTLNGQLTRNRQMDLGIGQYIWRTSRDERVRPTHARLENTMQSWDNPPPVGGGRHLHPGEDFNCRCTAEPVIPGLTLQPT